MYRSFQEIEQALLNNKVKKTVALASSHDDDTLASVANARRRGIIDAVLIGKVDKTKELLRSIGESPDDYVFVDEEEETEAAKVACLLVAEKKADIPMKGIMPTSTFLRAILDKKNGFVPENGLISQATVYEYQKENRLLIITDCAINPAPVFEEKMKILRNAVVLAHQLGKPNPKVAVLAPVEVINTSMQSTVDAAMLSKAAQRGQIKGCVVDGPLALDGAISIEAAKCKGINSEVAGYADILVVPDLASGNIFTKSLVYFGTGSSSGTITGTTSGVIFTSRSDAPLNKYNSMLVAIMQTLCAAKGTNLPT